MLVLVGRTGHFCSLRRFQGIWTFEILEGAFTHLSPSHVSGSHFFPSQGPDLGITYLPWLSIDLWSWSILINSCHRSSAFSVLLPQSRVYQEGPVAFIFDFQLTVNSLIFLLYIFLERKLLSLAIAIQFSRHYSLLLSSFYSSNAWYIQSTRTFPSTDRPPLLTIGESLRIGPAPYTRNYLC